MIKFSKCHSCKHYIITDDIIPRCKAFPDGIPMEIFREEVEHTKPYKNDNGIDPSLCTRVMQTQQFVVVDHRNYRII